MTRVSNKVTLQFTLTNRGNINVDSFDVPEQTISLAGSQAYSVTYNGTTIPGLESVKGTATIFTFSNNLQFLRVSGTYTYGDPATTSSFGSVQRVKVP